MSDDCNHDRQTKECEEIKHGFSHALPLGKREAMVANYRLNVEFHAGAPDKMDWK